jgi:hypothetical protein
MSSVQRSAWSPKDLTSLWPQAPLTMPLASCYSSKTVIQGPGQFGGWKVLETELHKVTTHSIPKHYGNVLGIINSKIMWLQSSCIPKCKVPKKQQHTLDSMIQNCRRNLVFTYRVRSMFYTEVETALYPGAAEEDVTIRSSYLDTWLYIEFNRACHCPCVYMELVETQEAIQHPKEIRLEGDHKSWVSFWLHSHPDSRMASLGTNK